MAASNMSNLLDDYESQFGERSPEVYFTDANSLREAVSDAIKRGRAYTEREWLEAADYTEKQIQEILDGERDI